MKPMLLLIVLLWAGTAGAEINCTVNDPKSVCNMNSRPSQTEERLFRESEVTIAFQSFLDKVVPDIKHDRDCLDKMERAMKAIEPFTIRSWGYNNHEEVHSLETIIDMDKFYEARTLWSQVKHECWSKP